MNQSLSRLESHIMYLVHTILLIILNILISQSFFIIIFEIMTIESICIICSKPSLKIETELKQVI